MTASTAGWRIVPFDLAPAAEQLERSEVVWRAVAAGAAPPTLRWYSYSAPAVVLGVGQRREIVDSAACARAGISVAQRTSGGTAVLGNREMLALDVALPGDHPLADQDVLGAYHWLGRVFRDALEALTRDGPARLALVGIDEARADQAAQRTAPRTEAAGRRGLACFGTLSPYEVALAPDGPAALRKLVGLSQIRKRSVVMFQVGLYTLFDGYGLARLLSLKECEREALGAELDRRVAGLEDIGVPAHRLPELRSLVERGILLACAGQGCHGDQVPAPGGSLCLPPGRSALLEGGSQKQDQAGQE